MKLGKETKRLVESVREVQDVALILHKDLSLSLEKLIPLVMPFASGPGDLPGVTFWTRTTIRSLMGLLDGLSFSMRQAVLRCAKDAGVTLTPKEQEKLKDSHLRTLDSAKLAFRAFPRLFGSRYTLDTGGEEWRGLQRIVKIRNKFTHPKVLEDLALHPAFPALMPTIDWVHREILTIFGDIEQHFGLSPREIPDLGIPAFRESQAPWTPIFKKEDYTLIKGHGGRTLEYVTRMFSMLSDDTKAAMDFTRGAFPTFAGPLLPPILQFAFRTYVRTLFSEIEGTISAAKFFIEAAVERGTVTLSEADSTSLEGGEVEDRFVAACNLWAREFGNDYILEKIGANWKHLRGARAFRNRITHPKDVGSLRVDLDLMDTLMGAHGYFMEGWGEGLYLSDKWAEKAGGINEVIEKEEVRSKEDSEPEEM